MLPCTWDPLRGCRHRGASAVPTAHPCWGYRASPTSVSHQALGWGARRTVAGAPASRAVYLHPADNYHRLTWPIFTRAKRPIREGSHGLAAALLPLATPSTPAMRTHVASS